MEKIYASIEQKLNSIIDSELEKDINETDCELISECSNGILRMYCPESYQMTDDERKHNINRIYADANREKPKIIFSKKAIGLILAAAMLCLIFVIGATGNEPFEYDIIQYSNHVRIITYLREDSRVPKLKVGYTPEGFHLTKEIVTKYRCNYTYEDDSGNSLIISNEHLLMKTNYSVMYDPDEESREDITIDGQKYHYIGYNDKDNCLVFFFKDTVFYRIQGDVSKEEALKIAQSIN